MSSSTTTISSKNSTMNNNDRKRPISSSIRPSPSPPSSKRHSLSSTNLQNSTAKKNLHRIETNEILLKKSTDHNDRQSRTKQVYRHIDNKSSSSESSRSSSNSNHSINQEYSSTTTLHTFNSTNDIQSSNEVVTSKRSHYNSINHSKQKSDVQKDFLYTKKPPALALIVKPSSNIDQRNFGSISNSDDEYEQPKQISNKVFTKSTSVLVPSSVMTIVKTPDLSKKSIRTDNVIIQQSDGTINSNSSTKLVKLVVPQTTNISSSSIKMLSSGDGLASALRIPAKIQLTKTLFVSSVKNDETSSLISSTLSSNLLDIQDNIPTLPPTPPPPVIDNTNSNIRNVLSHHTSNNQQQKINETTTIDIKAIEEIDPSIRNEHSNHQNTPKRQLSTVSADWCVPPTSELSPTSLTSSSPDLTQNNLPIDDSLVELDSTVNCRKSTKRRHRSLSSTSSSVLPSFTMSYLQSNKTTLLKPIKSKPSTRLSNSSDMKFILNNNNKKRSSRTSPVLKLSSAQRIRKRRHKNENIIHNQQNNRCSKARTKHFQTNDSQFIIKDILNGIIERIMSTNHENDNALKMLLNTSIPQIKHKLPISRITTRQPKTEIVLRTNSVNKKNSSLSQSSDSIVSNESRSMTMTSRELDELAYLLHANVHRGDYEQIDNPTKVEERMREMWSQMSNQKKNSYYKRVIEIYKRPNRDIVIASSSTNENNSLLSNDLTNDTATSSLPINSLSLELRRQTSTPLSFHSIPSTTTTDEQSIISPEESNFKTNLSTDIVNELIKGANGLDKLSSSPTAFINSIRNFVRSPIDKQIQIVNNLQQQIEKKCSTQLNRAQIFWTQKIHYFANKYQINSSNESVNELTLIVKYFYLLVLSLNCQKQEAEIQAALTNLLNGNLTSVDESYCSPTLTSIIEDLILPSSLANEYLASQSLIINNNEYSLPFIRNTELENELLNNNDIDISVNPFSNYNDLDDYLKRCENMTTTIPSYSIQQPQHPPMYYPTYHPSSQYYYPPSQSTDMNNYYYNNPTPAYPNSQQQQQQQIYLYGPSTSYYHPSATYNNDQSNYYYNSQQQQQQSSYAYSLQANSTNDIPLSNNPSLYRTYRQMNPNIQRIYRNPQQSIGSGATSIISGTSSTSTVFDGTTVVSPQSKSMNTTNNNYPP